MPRTLRVIAPAVLLALTLVSLFVGLALGGAADERTVADPGDVVRFGLPVARALVNLSMAGMIGSLVMAVWALAVDRPESRVAMDLASGSAAVLTVAATASLLFTYIDVSGEPFATDAVYG
ncbi:MAG: copper transporter, partial [Microbacteriaceae bacterium]|nr:copper transporter [Microbacteriaceae bacterium]